MKARVLGIALTSGVMLAAEAQAVPQYVDFTSGVWSTAEGASEATLSYGGIDITLSASGGLLTTNAADAPTSSSSADMSLVGDGIGIGDDEIGLGESLTVSFSSVVSLLSFDLLDLFPNEGTGGEQFMVDFGASGSQAGVAGLTDASGYFGSGYLGLDGIQSITFSAFGGAWSDFALGGLWIDAGGGIQTLSLLAAEIPRVPVPEPGPLLLLGAGVLLLGAGRAIRSRGALSRIA